MAENKFTIVLPTNPDPRCDGMSQFTVRGRLLSEPQQFSINFVNSVNCTDNITYHFKVVVGEQLLIENYKIDGEWSDEHKETQLNVFDESTFSLEFKLDYPNSTIFVYQVREMGHNFVTRYETRFGLSEIKSVQVWGDVQKINAFSLNYD